MLAERSVDAGLPARPAGAEPLDYVLVETQRHEFLRGVDRRPAAADHLVADPQFGLVEPLVGQLRRGIGILGDLARDLLIAGCVQLGQVAAQGAFVLWHLPSSSK